MKKRVLLLFTLVVGIITVPMLKANNVSDAVISGVEIELKSDGTLPFDNEDTKGKDSNATNERVRTYDEIIYDFNVGINGSNNDKMYDIEVLAELPDINTPERLKLKWISSNFNSEDVKIEKDGSVMKFYIRNLRAGQLYTKSLVLETKSLDEGFIIKPKFTTKIVGDAREVESYANKEVTVTSKTNLDVDLKYSETMSLQEINGVVGRVVPFAIDVKSRGDSSSKGKGNSFPIGDIEMILNLTTTKVDIDTNEESPVELDSSNIGVLDVGADDKFGNQIRINRGIGSGPTTDSPTDVADGGKLEFSEIAPNKYKLVLKNYKITDHFPRLHWGSSQESNPNARDWTESYRYFASHVFEMFVPLISDNDRSYDIRAKLDIEEINFKDAEGSHIMDSYTSNNTRTVVVPDYVEGSYSLGNYTTDRDNEELDRPKWSGQNARILRNNGKGIIKPLLGFRGHDSEMEGLQGGSQMMTLFQGDKIGITSKPDYYVVNANHNAIKKFNVWYGVGKLTKEEVTSNTTTTDSLTWYATLDEARKAEQPENGIYICGVICDSKDNLWGTGNPQLYAFINFKVRPENTVAFEAIATKARARIFYNKERTKFKDINPSYIPASYDINGDILSGTQIPSDGSGGSSMLLIPYETSVKAQSKSMDGNPQTSFDLRKGNTIKWEIDTAINSGQTEAITDKISVIHKIPSGESYKEGSATITPISITVLDDGSTELLWEFDGYNPENELPTISFQTTVPLITEDRTQLTHTTIVRANGDNRLEKDFRTDKDTITILADASMQISKNVNKDFVEVNEDFTYTLTYTNASDKDYNNGIFLDVLPYNGDSRTSDYSGNYIIEDIVLPVGVKAFMTDQDPATIKPNPLDNNVNNWKEFKRNSEVTALKFEVSDILKRTEREIEVKVKPNGNKKDNIYGNNYNAALEGLDIPLISNNVLTKVIGRDLSGTVWYDSNGNAIIDSDETLIDNIDVKLLEPSGKVLDVTKTNGEGKYKFSNLPTGEYTAEFEVPGGTNPTKLGNIDNNNENHTKISEGKLISQKITLEKHTTKVGIRNLGVMPNIEVEKEINDSSISPGSVTSWTLSVANISKVNGTVKEVELVDNVPVGVEVLEESITDNGVYNEENRNITWTLNDIKAGEKKSTSFSAKVTGKNPNDLRNIALVKPYERNPEPIPSEPVEMPIVEAIKTSNPESNTSLNVGQEITYSVKVDNIGNAKALNTSVEDSIPEYTELVPGSISHNGTVSNGTISWNVPEINTGESITVQFKVKVKVPEDLYTATITNTARVNGTATNSVEHIVNLPHLVFNKATNTPVDIPLEEGSEIEYVINITNEGEAPSEEINVKDNLPQGVTGSETEWTLPPLEPKESKSIVFKVRVDDLPSGEYNKILTNVATVNGENTNEVTHNITKSDLKYSKTSNVPNNTIVREGSEIEYKIVLDNKGTANTKDITVLDALPEQIKLKENSISDSGIYDETNHTITWNMDKVNAVSIKELKFIGIVKELPSGVYENTITNTATVNGENTNNTVHLVKKPNIIANKEISNLPSGKVVLENDRLDYVIRIQNNGTLPKDNIIITDIIPNGSSYINDSANLDGVMSDNTIKWEIPVLDVGEEVLLRFSVTANELNTGEITGLVENTAIVDGKNTNTVIIPVDTFRQQTIKLVSNDVAVIGDKLRYNVEVTNTGSLDLQNVIVTDKIPTHTKVISDSISEHGNYNKDSETITWNIPSIAKDSKIVVSFEVTVLDTARDNVITNIANVNGHPTNEVQTEVVERGITGTVWLDSNKNGKLQTDEKGIEGITVELLDTLNNVIETALTDDLGVYQFSNLQSGEYKVKFELPSGTNITKKHLIETEDTSHVETNMISSSRTLGKIQLKKPVLNLGVIPVLEITKEVDKDHVQNGEAFNYTINVINTSTVGEPITDVLVEDILQEGISHNNLNNVDWLIPTISNGETLSKTFEVTLNGSEVNHITNKAVIKSYGKVLDVTESNEVDTAVINTRKSSEIEGEYLQPGDTIKYSIKVTNRGNTVATDIKVKDNLSNELELIGGKVSSIERLNAGETETIELSCRVKESTLNGNIANTAQVDNIDTNTVIDPVKTPFIEHTKSSTTDTNVFEGDEISYSITVMNTGAGKSDTVVVEDVLPEGLTLIEDSITASGAKKSNGVVWKLPSMEPGSSRELKFKAIVDQLPENIFTMKYENIGTVNGENTNSVEHISTKGNLLYHKEGDIPYDNILNPGDNIKYKIVLENNGESPLDNIRVKDNIPTGTELINHDGILNNDTVEWVVPKLDKKEILELNMEVKVLDLKEENSSEIINTAIVQEEETNKITNQVKVPKLEFNKSSSRDSGEILLEGDELTYYINVSNVGEFYKENTVVKDIVPVGTTLKDIPSDANYDEDSRELVWNIDKLEKDSEKVLEFTILIDEFADEVLEKKIVNIATVDEIATNEVKHYVAKEKYEFRKFTTTEVAEVGKPIEYGIEVINTGSKDLKDIVIKDTLPKFVELCNKDEKLEWIIEELKVGEREVVSFEVIPLESARGNKIINIAQVNDKDTNEVVHYIPVPPSDSEDKPIEKPPIPIEPTDKPPIQVEPTEKPPIKVEPTDKPPVKVEPTEEPPVKVEPPIYRPNLGLPQTGTNIIGPSIGAVSIIGISIYMKRRKF